MAGSYKCIRQQAKAGMRNQWEASGVPDPEPFELDIGTVAQVRSNVSDLISMLLEHARLRVGCSHVKKMLLACVSCSPHHVSKLSAYILLQACNNQAMLHRSMCGSATSDHFMSTQWQLSNIGLHPAHLHINPMMTSQLPDTTANYTNYWQVSSWPSHDCKALVAMHKASEALPS
jgi:hypothetical protein